MRTDEMLRLVEELEGIASGGGYADPDVLKRAKAICFSLSLEPVGWRFEIASAEHYVEVLYSARKHERVPGGAAGARSFLLGDCYKLRMKIAQHEAAQVKR